MEDKIDTHYDLLQRFPRIAERAVSLQVECIFANLLNDILDAPDDYKEIMCTKCLDLISSQGKLIFITKILQAYPFLYITYLELQLLCSYVGQLETNSVILDEVVKFMSTESDQQIILYTFNGFIQKLTEVVNVATHCYKYRIVTSYVHDLWSNSQTKRLDLVFRFCTGVKLISQAHL